MTKHEILVAIRRCSKRRHKATKYLASLMKYASLNANEIPKWRSHIAQLGKEIDELLARL